MISHKHKCIFVHIPKCGGSSIEDIIWPTPTDKSVENLWMGFETKFSNKYQTGGLQHLKAKQIRQEVGAEVFDKYYKFTMVRNPWDKAVSQYEYMKKRADLREFAGISDNEEFISYLDKTRKVLHVQWEKQTEFLYDEQGQLIVDFIGRFEDFEKNVYQILDDIKIGKKLFGFRLNKIPHEKKSVRSHYRDYYDDESKEMVAEIYQDDIEKFSYQF